MRVVPTAIVGADDRTHHQHRRPGGAHDAGQHRADGQQQRVLRRAAMQIAAHRNAAAHGIERGEQNDEGQVLVQKGVQRSFPGDVHAETEGKGDEKQRSPARSDLALMVMPHSRGKQRHERDGQQHGREGQPPPQAERRRIRNGLDGGGRCQTRQQAQQHRGRSTGVTPHRRSPHARGTAHAHRARWFARYHPCATGRTRWKARAADRPVRRATARRRLPAWQRCGWPARWRYAFPAADGWTMGWRANSPAPANPSRPPRRSSQ